MTLNGHWTIEQTISTCRSTDTETSDHKTSTDRSMKAKPSEHKAKRCLWVDAQPGGDNMIKL